MLDKSRVEHLVCEHLSWLRHSCGVDDWNILVGVRRLNDGDQGVAYPDSAYLRCDIYLDYDGFDNDYEVLETLRHEIIHSTLGMLNLYTNITTALIGDPDASGEPRMADAHDRARTFASEQMTLRLEKVMRINKVPLETPEWFEPQGVLIRESGKIELRPSP